MNLISSDLKYFIFSGRNPAPEYSAIYQEAFRCWHHVWTETLLELDGNGTLYSDDFERQTEIQALMYGNRCVALLALHEVDFSLPTAKLDSWFKVWPKDSLDKLIEDGGRVLVGSNVTVHKDFRGDLGNGLRLKTLLLDLMVHALREREADVLCGTTRNNRGVNTATYNTGAVQIGSNIQLHGVDVDLVAYYRKRLESVKSDLSNIIVESIWRNRIEYLGRKKSAYEPRPESHYLNEAL